MGIVCHICLVTTDIVSLICQVASGAGTGCIQAYFRHITGGLACGEVVGIAGRCTVY